MHQHKCDEPSLFGHNRTFLNYSSYMEHPRRFGMLVERMNHKIRAKR